MYVFYIMRIYSYKNYVHNCILGHVLISKYINENHPKNQQPSVFLCIIIYSAEELGNNLLLPNALARGL